jgi:hypothetical protein
MELHGLARLSHESGSWTAYPLVEGPGADLAVSHRWGIDVNHCVRLSPVQLRPGTRLRITVDVDVPFPWTNETPDGLIAEARSLQPLTSADIHHSTQAFYRNDSLDSDEQIDALVERAIRTIPGWWPIFEVEQSKPSSTGWHTKIHTLTNVDKAPLWPRGLHSSLLQVRPWLSRHGV